MMGRAAAEGFSDLRRIVSASGVYALGALAQRGVAFLLLPVYTRYLDPVEYGVLELLNAFSSVVFAVLALGLPSAIMKCYHRDSRDRDDRQRVLTTAVVLALPVLLAGGGALMAMATTVSRWLVGDPSAAGLVRLVVATGVLSSLTSLVLASLRARERAVAFSLLSLGQLVAAVTLNVVLVAGYGMGVRGVLLGNLVANALALPAAMLTGHRSARLAAAPRLVSPLLRFGLLLIPVMLATWVMDLSDRYLLGFFTDLEEVAIYGVGYKLGMVLQVAVVWPFQLAWPAFSFSISRREGHRETYARTLTYLVLMLVFGVLALGILGRVALLGLVGEGYREAYRVVPWVALAYALNGVHYCAATGVHLAGKTRYFPPLALAAAALNFGLNLWLIPRWGMMGAAASTVAAFLLLAAGTLAVGQRFYPVPYQGRRLGKILAAGVLVLIAGTRVAPAATAFSITWHILVGLLAFPAVLALLGFWEEEERLVLRQGARRYVPFLVH